VMDGRVIALKSTYKVVIGWMGACGIKADGGLGVLWGSMALTLVVVNALVATVAKAPFFETTVWAASSAIAELSAVYIA